MDSLVARDDLKRMRAIEGTYLEINVVLTDTKIVLVDKTENKTKAFKFHEKY